MGSLTKKLKRLSPMGATMDAVQSKGRMLKKIGIGEDNFFYKTSSGIMQLDGKVDEVGRPIMRDYGPANLPSTAGIDPLIGGAQKEGEEGVAKRVETYLTADEQAEEAERQRLAAEQLRLEEESRAAMGGELLRRRRRRRESGLIASGFGSVTSGYKTVLGV